MEATASLMEVPEGIRDPRGARGRRHPLPALLALAVVAMLAGMTSYEAIVDYGKERGGEFLRLLGFTRRRGLCKATYSRVFRRIHVAEFESCVGQWIRGKLGPGDASHLAVNGKTARASSPPPAAQAEAEIGRVCEVDKGHGRVEKRTIEVTSSLAGYLGSDWPGCEQVFRLTRERTIKGKTETNVVFGITSLSRERAGAKKLSGLTRRHRGIENGLHGVRDWTLREDASRIRKGSGPEVMAALRNIVIFLFKRLGHTNAAAATRHYVCNPQKSLELLSIPI